MASDAVYNPPPSGETEDNIDKMRGDAVGNTMYSERWILKILMQLTKLSSEQWTSDLETEVCVLWDMSAEEDVVQLLMQHDMLSLATHIIVNSDKHRLTEIMVGIIGNMCCIESVRNELGNRPAIVEVLLELLSRPDVPTLVQVLRVLKTCAWDVRKKLQSENQRSNNEIKSNAQNTEKKQVDRRQELLDCDHKTGEDEAIGKDENNDDVLSPSNIMNLKIQVFKDMKLHNEPDETSSPSVSGSKSQLEDDIPVSVMQSAAAMQQEKRLPTECWLKHFQKMDLWLPKIIFILTSSKHDELLSCTWSFLDTVCYIPVGETFLSQAIVDSDLMVSLLESYKEYFEESFNTEDTNDIEPIKKAAGHWVSILYSFTLHQDGIAVLCQYKADVMNNIFNMLHYCHSSVALDEELTTFITSSLAVLDVFLLDEPYELICLHSGLHSVIKLWEELSESKSMKIRTNEDTHLEEEAVKALEDYFVSVKQWLDPKQTDNGFKKLHYIHRLLSELLNSRVT